MSATLKTGKNNPFLLSVDILIYITTMPDLSWLTDLIDFIKICFTYIVPKTA